jgi:hypothetical protein
MSFFSKKKSEIYDVENEDEYEYEADLAFQLEG